MHEGITGEQADQVIATANKIFPLLAGLSEPVQSAVIADLAARWLAGWAPSVRHERLMLLLALIGHLTEINEKIVFGEAGHPGGRH